MTYLSFPTYLLLAREKSSATKDITKSVLVALLTFLAANNSLSLSSSAVTLNEIVSTSVPRGLQFASYLAWEYNGATVYMLRSSF